LLDFIGRERLGIEGARQLVERRSQREEAILVLDRPDPDGEVLLVARPPELRSHRVATLLLEMLDVGVVAIIEAALFPQPLHEAAVELAVLAEGAARDRD